jgi:hypothetical protein
MKPEQQRKAIAEACGWKYVPEDIPEYPWQDREGEASRHCPDYLNDLNAMHEAEKTLNQNLAAEYARMLTSTAWQSEQPTFAPMTATAAQRAESFLRTINKWEETKL